ncbi:response regulator [Microvirga sp. STR05]|uniref:Response regulator n=1 Tax=Hymenobacter duratus TaxID=2771356 RepID=A0ABR8JE86_9BACT|nr:response regulator [Hymenobacter duratus]MBD2715162.1 response regulator [Hymenobacter duratus]MBR7950069.1 response regulator [Microvirga sp. STR05]
MRIETYLIDDDSLSIYLTEQLLRAEGFSNLICTFVSATKALQQLVQNKEKTVPQVVFLDLNMPVMNGWQFLEALEPYTDELQGRCQIYILTSSLALSDMEKAKQYELVAGLIHKPIDSEEIKAIQARLQEQQG